MSTASSLSDGERAWVMELAQKTVIGVTNARLRGDVNDSTLVIQAYCSEVMDSTGCDLGTAWSLLFAAALANFSDAILDMARANDMSPAAMLAEWALSCERAAIL